MNAKKNNAPDEHRANWFNNFAKNCSLALGSPAAFFFAVLTIAVWAASGPFFEFSESWQIVINTATTIVTFLMVFLIQNTQNRDAHIFQLKLDELIRATRDARNELLDLEDLSDDELEMLSKHFKDICAQYRKEHPRV